MLKCFFVSSAISMHLFSAGHAYAQNSKTVVATAGCREISQTQKLYDLKASGDQEALDMFLLAATMSDACKVIEGKVYVEDFKFFSAMECVRPVGEISCYWIAFQSLVK